jgi:hypothetical protein
MNGIAFLDLFQGIATLAVAEPKIASGAVMGLIAAGLPAHLSGQEGGARSRC